MGTSNGSILSIAWPDPTPAWSSQRSESETRVRDDKNANGMRRMIAWYDRDPLLGL